MSQLGRKHTNTTVGNSIFKAISAAIEAYRRFPIIVSSLGAVNGTFDFFSARPIFPARESKT